MSHVKLIECPRDAMQGIHTFISTDQKVRYINQLLQVGFDTLDFGSFVSPIAIPQLRDTKEVIPQLDLSNTTTKLLAIVGNLRGAEEASAYDEVHYLGFPFSISETFQQRNINSTVADSFQRATSIQELAQRKGKEVVLYISMAFGNPYGDPWNRDIVIEWSERLHTELGVQTISLSDTVGAADPETISYLFSALVPALPKVEFGAHLHTTPTTWRPKVQAAHEAGCNRFDGAIKGLGGCPMASDKLTGNMPTENLLHYFQDTGTDLSLNIHAFADSMQLAGEVFPLD